uniref:Uncharacterized protein n=1 Tax=Glossina austeni TaxID=7395 RepID=A0A1A9UED4_GLOAU
MVPHKSGKSNSTSSLTVYGLLNVEHDDTARTLRPKTQDIGLKSKIRIPLLDMKAKHRELQTQLYLSSTTDDKSCKQLEWLTVVNMACVRLIMVFNIIMLTAAAAAAPAVAGHIDCIQIHQFSKGTEYLEIRAKDGPIYICR